MANPPKRLKKRYDKIVRSSGRDFADRWLARQLERPGGRAGDSRGRDPGRIALGRVRGARKRVDLSECTRKYAELLANPFNVAEVPEWCLPLPPSMPNQRLSTFVKATLTTGTGGYGFVAFNPDAMIFNDISEPNRPVWMNDSSWSGSTVIAPGGSPSTNNSHGYLSNSPYSVTDIGTGDDMVQYRLVAAGLRVKYFGTELARGGLVVGYQNKSGITLAGTDISGLMTRDGVDACTPQDDKWYEITYAPPAWDTGSAHGYSFGSSSEWSMVIMVERPDTANIKFFVEAYAHFECIGGRARGKIPPTEDTVGANAVIAGMQTTSSSFADYAERLEKVYDGAVKFMAQGSRVVDVAQRMAAKLEL